MLYCSVRLVVLVDLLFLSLEVFEFCERRQAKNRTASTSTAPVVRKCRSRAKEVSKRAQPRPVVTKLWYVRIANMDEGKTPSRQCFQPILVAVIIISYRQRPL
jgi:hypothetical protein